MASDTVYMKRHDTRPYLDVRLTDADGNAYDLSASGTTVTFTMKKSEDATIKVDSQSCTIVNASTGAVRYEWAAANTNTAETYLGEFEVTYSNGDKMTFPSKDVLAIVILEDYNNV